MWMEYMKTMLRFDIYVLCYSNLPMMFLPHDYFSGMNKMDRVLSQTRWARLFEGGGIWTLKDHLSKSLSFLFFIFLFFLLCQDFIHWAVLFCDGRAGKDFRHLFIHSLPRTALGT